MYHWWCPPAKIIIAVTQNLKTSLDLWKILVIDLAFRGFHDVQYEETLIFPLVHLVSNEKNIYQPNLPSYYNLFYILYTFVI